MEVLFTMRRQSCTYILSLSNVGTGACVHADNWWFTVVKMLLAVISGLQWLMMWVVMGKNSFFERCFFLSESQHKWDGPYFFGQFYLMTDLSEIFIVVVKLNFKYILRMDIFDFRPSHWENCAFPLLFINFKGIEVKTIDAGTKINTVLESASNFEQTKLLMEIYFHFFF